MFFTKKILVYESQRALLLRNGKFVSVLEPGRHAINRNSEEIVLFDLRQSSMQIGGQEVTTLDGASIRLSMVVHCSITDPLKLYRKMAVDSTYGPVTSGAANWPIHHEVQIQIREWMSPKTLQEVIDNRADFDKAVLEPVKLVGQEHGIEVEKVRLLDFNMTGSLKSAHADVLKAELEGRAAMQRVRNEAATLRSLVNSAKLTQDHPGLLELRILASGQKPRVTFMVGQPEVAKQTLAEESSE